ncbi:hypothetical protein FNV43_RR01542 [Rhamnella rubrinervis]|uniref:Uncharacterized protein n=1 Tax=Rhamnella rubrinervis TaxID=2594499 RepID=A0A8K0HRN7_9ROSA|nr:hypothetical protein FNV43_RR01542 [Rhamnella rubrinervis]
MKCQNIIGDLMPSRCMRGQWRSSYSLSQTDFRARWRLQVCSLSILELSSPWVVGPGQVAFRSSPRRFQSLVMPARLLSCGRDKDFKSFVKHASLVGGRCRDINDKITLARKNFFRSEHYWHGFIGREEEVPPCFTEAQRNYAGSPGQMVEDGDRNSKFFHSLLRVRKSQRPLSSLSIQGINISDETTITCWDFIHSDVVDAVKSFFLSEPFIRLNSNFMVLPKVRGLDGQVPSIMLGNFKSGCQLDKSTFILVPLSVRKDFGGLRIKVASFYLSRFPLKEALRYSSSHHDRILERLAKPPRWRKVEPFYFASSIRPLRRSILPFRGGDLDHGVHPRFVSVNNPGMPIIEFTNSEIYATRHLRSDPVDSMAIGTFREATFRIVRVLRRWRY